MRWPRGTRSPQPLHLRSKGGLGLVSISYGTAIMRRFQLDWNASLEIGSAATEGGFLPVLIRACTHKSRIVRQPLAAANDVCAPDVQAIFLRRRHQATPRAPCRLQFFRRSLVRRPAYSAC